MVLSKYSNSLTNRWIGLVAVLFATFFFGAGMNPEKLWAIHDIWFLESSTSALFVLGAICLGVVGYYLQKLWLHSGVKSSLVWPMAILVVAASNWVYYYYPICFDDYGNAFDYRNYADVIADSTPPNFISDLFSFKIEPSSGRKTVLNAFALISFDLQLPYDKVFQLSSLVSGLLYSTGMLFISARLTNWTSRLSFLIIAVFAPVTMVFHNHFELYAPVYTSVTVWFALFYLTLNRNSKLTLLLLGLWSIICFKIHPLSAVLTIGFLLTSLLQFSRTRDKVVWKNVVLLIVFPAVMLGACVYFFVAKDYNDPRFLEGVTDAERIFLPIVSPQPPLHNYNLFSWNHFLDYFNAMLLWSIPAWMVVLYGMLNKRVNWNNPFIIIPGSMGLLVALFLFAINPLLSMPMDRDLFMFPTLFLLVLAIGVLQELSQLKRTKMIIPVVLFFAVLQTPRIIVDNKPNLLSEKLQVTGTHIYKTYYLHSVRVIINGLNLTGNAEDYIAGKQRIINELKPLAAIGNDPKYANLLMDDGNFYLRYANDPQKASERLQEALRYDPNSDYIKALLQEANQKRLR